MHRGDPCMAHSQSDAFLGGGGHVWGLPALCCVRHLEGCLGTKGN